MSQEPNNTIDRSDIPTIEPKKTRKEIQDAIRNEKALAKAAKKA